MSKQTCKTDVQGNCWTVCKAPADGPCMCDVAVKAGQPSFSEAAAEDQNSTHAAQNSVADVSSPPLPTPERSELESALQTMRRLLDASMSRSTELRQELQTIYQNITAYKGTVESLENALNVSTEERLAFRYPHTTGADPTTIIARVLQKINLGATNGITKRDILTSLNTERPERPVSNMYMTVVLKRLKHSGQVLSNNGRWFPCLSDGGAND